MLDVPLATHGFATGFATFGIEQSPTLPSGRFSAASRIVLLEASFHVSRPANIGAAIIFPSAPQNINEKELFVL